MKIFFKNVPDIGPLKIEHVFYEYGEPTLFVCTDTGEDRYLCACCRLGEEWLVGQVLESTLVKMIDDKIALDEVFQKESKVLFALSWNGMRLKVLEDIEEDMYPEPGALLELSDEEDTIRYRESLQAIIEKKMLVSTTTQKAETWTSFLENYAFGNSPLSSAGVLSSKIKVDTDFVSSESERMVEFDGEEFWINCAPVHPESHRWTVSLKNPGEEFWIYCAPVHPESHRWTVSLKNPDVDVPNTDQGPNPESSILVTAA